MVHQRWTAGNIFATREPPGAEHLEDVASKSGYRERNRQFGLHAMTPSWFAVKIANTPRGLLRHRDGAADVAFDRSCNSPRPIAKSPEMRGKAASSSRRR